MGYNFKRKLDKIYKKVEKKQNNNKSKKTLQKTTDNTSQIIKNL